jgi:hypothetical protein
MQIDLCDEHHSNASPPSTEILAPVAKDKSDRLPHALKQQSEIISSDEGRQID